MSEQNQEKALHWADLTADRIIKQLGDKECYTLASGITPSGVVHFGNFRESITVDFVSRALRERGKKVRFIFSWDDFDTFRKIPKNMPKQEHLQKFLFQPIVDTPDPYDREESYARHHEVNFENQLKLVGINPTPIYQAKAYRAGAYNVGIKTALEKKDVIYSILNEHRTEDLDDNWMPVSIYCESCNRDKMKLIEYDGDDTLTYECELCNHHGKEKITGSKRVKLPWRVDWPMRWAHEQVDFEPGGKDHSSEGGSYTTAKEIVAKVYGFRPPVYLQYDFVSIKGAGGKMSSSSGEVITVNDVLNIYEPEMVRWIFASYKTNIDFAISFDLDVIKTYEDFDKQERLAYGKEEGNDKKVAMAKRVYELSQIDGVIPKEMPFQPSFRHLTNILQIHEGDIQAAKDYYQSEIKNERDLRRFEQRSQCALFWLKTYAPEDFKFSVNTTRPEIDLKDKEKEFLSKLGSYLKSSWDSIQSGQELHEKIYGFMNELTLTPNEIFPVMYKILISKERGPKLADFILTLGKEKVLRLI